MQSVIVLLLSKAIKHLFGEGRSTILAGLKLLFLGRKGFEQHFMVEFFRLKRTAGLLDPNAYL